MRARTHRLHHKPGSIELIDLAKDPSEKTNLAGNQPEKVKELRAAFDAWLAPMADPITGGAKRVDRQPKPSEKPLTEREKKRARIRAEKKKQREAEKKKQREAEKKAKQRAA